MHCDQACIQAVIPRRKNNASPSPWTACSEQLVASRRSAASDGLLFPVRSGWAIGGPLVWFNGVFFDGAAGCVRCPGGCTLVPENAVGSSAPVPVVRTEGSFWRVFDEEGQNLVGQFVCLLGTAFVGNQAGKPILNID